MSVKFKIESGVQLMARLTKKPKIEKFYPTLFQSGPTSGDIIEFFSDTCVSHLLIDIISEALIQTTINGTPAAILIFDTDGNLNYDELVNVLKRKLWSLENTTPMMKENVELNQKVYKTLTNLHIVNVYDATQFYATIYNLESILVKHSNISMIIFNTLSAFYWSEQGYKVSKMNLYTKNLINIIQKVTKEHKTVCMYTRPEYFSTNKEFENICTEVDYQIQLLDNGKGNYQVHVKTSNNATTKFFRVQNGDLKWISL